MLNFRNTPPRSGLLASFDQLSAVPGVNSNIINVLKQQCYLAPYAVRSVDMVGPKVGAELARQSRGGDAVRAGRNAGIYSISF